MIPDQKTVVVNLVVVQFNSGRCKDVLYEDLGGGFVLWCWRTHIWT